MGTTYATFETRIRQDLSDSGSPPLLSGPDLDRHVDHAVRDLALVAPLDQLRTVTLTPGSRSVDLTATLAPYQLIRLDAVEWPVNQFPQEFVQFSLFGAQTGDPLLTLLVEQPPSFQGPDTASGTIVHQSDFEDGTLQGWAASDGIATLQNVTGYAWSGTHGLSVTSDQTGTGAIDTADTLTAGTGYQASLWIWGVTGRQYQLCALRTDTSATFARQTVTGLGGWQQITLFWIQPATTGVAVYVVDLGVRRFPRSISTTSPCRLRRWTPSASPTSTARSRRSPPAARARRRCSRATTTSWRWVPRATLRRSWRRGS
jgi:Carbohydrate binding domain